MKLWSVLSLSMLFLACASKKPKGTFENDTRPTAPNYADANAWAALPNKSDLADLWAGGIEPSYKGDDVDVFFLYPTIYTGSKSYQTHWNAPIDMLKFNQSVEESSIKYQASVFNSVGRIYAPRYRQAHLKCYFMKNDTASCRKAFDLAYEDVKMAFDYYLKHYNQDRPIILASHSQGTTHMARLMKEYFDDNPALRNKLVVAYIVGIPVPTQYFKTIPLCQNPTQTGCFCSWRTFQTGHEPRKQSRSLPIGVVNPLTWKSDETYAPDTLNQGAIFRNFDKITPNANDAQVHGNILWTRKPKFKGSFLMRTKNYHAGDFNIFYFNIRQNANQRIQAFWK